MNTILQGILLGIIGILLFGLIIFIHELGHFFTAKLSRIRVNEFAIGMGPKLFSFTREETQYALRLLPIVFIVLLVLVLMGKVRISITRGDGRRNRWFED